jgi:hypothetical protein
MSILFKVGFILTKKFGVLSVKFFKDLLESKSVMDVNRGRQTNNKGPLGFSMEAYLCYSQVLHVQLAA